MQSDDEAIKDQLCQGLSEELKDVLSLNRSSDENLKIFIKNGKNLDNIVSTRNEDRKTTSRQVWFFAFQFYC